VLEQPAWFVPLVHFLSEAHITHFGLSLDQLASCVSASFQINNETGRDAFSSNTVTKSLGDRKNHAGCPTSVCALQSLIHRNEDEDDVTWSLEQDKPGL
jgi:hypothetical protein